MTIDTETDTEKNTDDRDTLHIHIQLFLSFMS